MIDRLDDRIDALASRVAALERRQAVEAVKAENFRTSIMSLCAVAAAALLVFGAALNMAH